MTHSVPSARALVDEVCRAYRIAAADCELLRAGTNDTYLLRSSGAVDLVRVYGAGSRSRSEIAYELASSGTWPREV